MIAVALRWLAIALVASLMGSSVLACREERGWKIEAKSNLAPGESTNMTAFGGGDMREFTSAVETKGRAPVFWTNLR